MMGEITAGVFGLAAGGITAAGVFALISALNLLPRFAGRSHTEEYIQLYEWMIILGGVSGNIFYLVQRNLPFPLWFGAAAGAAGGLFAGIFVGSLVMSLAETLDGIAVFGRRLKLTAGVAYIVLAVALGKLGGSILQFLWRFAKAE